MARLRALPPRVGRLPERGRRLERTESGARDKTQPGAQWYRTARWQKLRWKVLVEAAFTCCRCGRVEVRKGQMIADHKVPHRGDEALFWDQANLQAMCKACHDSYKQREDRRFP